VRSAPAGDFWLAANMAVRNTHAEAERRHAERNYCYSKLHLPGVPKMIVSTLGGVGASGQLRDVG
jgi:hypothetical protein